jgi:ATP-dependent DNA helicase UvrD/PcrA
VQRFANRLLDDLTDPQREAVLHEEGPLLVVAGPGSGKTRVITRRVAHLVSRGINPASILAITFTNKAAQEMSDRVRDVCPADGAWIRTFHSTCAAILRRWPEPAGLSSGFSIFDTKDQKRLVKQALDRLDLDSSELRPNQVLNAISNWKMADTLPEHAVEEADTYRARNLAALYTSYERALGESNAVDFDDLLVRTLRALRTDEELLGRLQYMFEYVMIDEYQDTSPVQFHLASLLAGRTQNLCATGDPDQSIYAFRKADLRNILEFEKHYPTAKVVRLEQNFRSVGNVLKAADALIENNVARHEKRLFTDKEDGALLRLVGCGTELDEGNKIAALILDAYGAGRPYKEMAVFYRTNAQSRAIEGGLRSHGVPYRIIKGVEFYQRQEVKDLLAYLKLLVNPYDWAALQRVLSTPPKGVGAKSILLIEALGAEEGLTARASLPAAAERAGLSRRASQALRVVEDHLADLEHSLQGPVEKLIRRLLELVRYEAYLRAKFKEDGDERVDNVHELVGAAEEYDERMGGDGSLVGFLTDVGLVSDVDGYDDDAVVVPLMTLHTSKGLEFDEVFIAGLEEGLLPHVRSLDDASALEEERRLLFVGITRARKRVTLSYALDRRAQIGSKGRESTFLDEIPTELFERYGFADASRTRDTYGTSAYGWGGGNRSSGGYGGGGYGGNRGRRSGGDSSWSEGVDAAPSYDGVDHDPDAVRLHEGLRVEHSKFGRGRIRRLMGQGIGAKAVVHFQRYGEKTLALSHAKLTPVAE